MSFQSTLRAYFGGLRIWQYPIQFGAYLHHLGQLDVRSYLDVGVRHGGAFVATIEYLRKVGALECAIGVDVIRAPKLEEYAAGTPGVEVARINSRSDQFDALLGTEVHSTLRSSIHTTKRSNAGTRFSDSRRAPR